MLVKRLSGAKIWRIYTNNFRQERERGIGRKQGKREEKSDERARERERQESAEAERGFRYAISKLLRALTALPFLSPLVPRVFTLVPLSYKCVSTLLPPSKINFFFFFKFVFFFFSINLFFFSCVFFSGSSPFLCNFIYFILLVFFIYFFYFLINLNYPNLKKNNLTKKLLKTKKNILLDKWTIFFFFKKIE